MRVRMSNRSAEFERDAPLESDSSFVPARRERRGQRALEAGRAARDAELLAGRGHLPAAPRSPARSCRPRAPPRARARSASARSRMRRAGGASSNGENPRGGRSTRCAQRYRAPPGIRAAACSRYRHAPDGHRLRPGGRAVRDLAPPARARAAPPAGRGDGRGRRRRCCALVYDPLVPQLRRALRAAVGARPDRAGSRPTTTARLRAHAASARDGRLDARDAVRRRRRPADALVDAAVLRRARVADLPARRASCSRPGSAPSPRSSC